jgi:hypothetical protein
MGKMEKKKFTLKVQGLPYEVSIIPFQFNNQKRFFVSYNGALKTLLPGVRT